MSSTGGSRDKPTTERIDTEAEQRELESAGWERVERQGKTVWRNPNSGHLYPQGAAITLIRRNQHSDDASNEESEDEA